MSKIRKESEVKKKRKENALLTAFHNARERNKDNTYRLFNPEKRNAKRISNTQRIFFKDMNLIQPKSGTKKSSIFLLEELNNTLKFATAKMLTTCESVKSEMDKEKELTKNEIEQLEKYSNNSSLYKDKDNKFTKELIANTQRHNKTIRSVHFRIRTIANAISSTKIAIDALSKKISAEQEIEKSTLIVQATQLPKTNMHWVDIGGLITSTYQEKMTTTSKKTKSTSKKKNIGKVYNK